MATAASRVIADKACYLIVQSRNNFRKSFHPGSGPLALRESHFHGVLVQTMVFNNGLVAVNVKAPAADICFVFFHLFV